MQGKPTHPAARNYHNEQQFCIAIKHRKVVRLRYENNFHYFVFDPYIVFKNSDGRVMVGGNRVKDEMKVEKKPGPRKYEVGLVSDIIILDQAFKVDYKFSSYREKYQEADIICAVDR